jgi:hypothetical protein
MQKDLDTAFIDTLNLANLEWEAINDSEAEAIIYLDGLFYYIIADYKIKDENNCDYEVKSVKILQKFDH